MSTRHRILGLTALIAGALTSQASVDVQAWYHLGEAGTLATGGLPVDGSGNGHNMNDGFSEFETVHTSLDTPGGPLGTSGYISTASSEWGRNGDVIIAALDGYAVTGDNFGIEAWVLPYGNGYNVFCCESAHNYTARIFGSGGDSTGLILGVQNNQDGTYSFVAGVVTDTAGTVPVGDPMPLITNAWTHLAVVRNNGVNTFYVNGVPNGATTTDAPSTNQPSGTGNQNGMVLGASGGDQLAYRGLIDEARAFTFNANEFSVTNLLYPSASGAAPQIAVQPVAATVWDGGAVSFSVQAVTSPNLTYQWRRNGADVTGATKATLFLPVVTLAADSGAVFSCALTNTNTSAFVLSSNATLTVAPVLANNIANYDNLVSGQPSLVAYFPADYDTGTTVTNTKSAAHNGVLEGNAAYDGRTDRAFGQRAIAIDRDLNSGDVQIPTDPAYSFPTGSGTFEAIVYMSGPGVYLNGSGWRFPTIFSLADPDQTSASYTYAIGVSYTGDQLYYDDGTTNTSWSVPVNLMGRFAHVALAFDQTSGVTAYADGQSLGTLSAFSLGSSLSPAWIGSFGSSTNSRTGTVWKGTIDEVAIYGAALSAGTINAHYAMFKYGTNTPPVILNAPSPVTILAGAANSTAKFSVTAEGTLPLSYQWESNGIPIPGATSPIFSIPNVTPSASATYTVAVSNSVAITNVSATLTVTSPSGYAAAVIADRPAAYWRLGEHSGPVALDSWGTNDGAYLGTETFGLTGVLAGDPNTAVHFAGDGASFVRVPYSSVLNGGLNPNGSFTVECWVKPDLKGADAGFAVPVASVDLNANRSGFFFLEQGNGWQLRLGNSSGYLPGWDAAAGGVGGEPQANTWYHLVAAYDGAASIGYIYINGVQVKSNSVEGLAINQAAPFYIGDRGDGAGFPGVIDEVAVYNTNLPPARVLAHYLGGVPPSITVTKSGANLILTWPTGTLQQANEVTGPYIDVSGATSGMSIAPSANRSFYRLKL